MTKLCVTSTGEGLDSSVDPRFGRCAYFVIVDPDTMEYQSVLNEAASASGGAGIRAAQEVLSLGAEVVLTGSVGPNAYPALRAADITIMTGASGTIRSAVESFKQGTLSKLTSPGPMYRGMGGRGRGRGGRGRGGRGRMGAGRRGG